MTVIVLLVNTFSIWGLNAAGGFTYQNDPTWILQSGGIWLFTSVLITMIMRIK